MKTKLLIASLCLILLSVHSKAQFITKYPEIPRIDVHAHPGNNYKAIRSLLEFREHMITETKADVAMWINVGARTGGETAIDTITEVSKNRIMTCISDYTPHKGLTHKAKDMPGYLKKGYVGYKIWYGTMLQQVADGMIKEGDKDAKYLYVDDPNNEEVIAAMEKSGMVMASLHIADPNGPFEKRTLCDGCYCPDPVEFWRSITGLERILQRHPNLVVVSAHGAWLMVQEAQLDYLRYLCKTYPNFYVDLAAGWLFPANRENLRDFFIEYSGHLLFATDIGWDNNYSPALSDNINNYSSLFRLYETDDAIEGFPIKQGLNLPKEVLENIYYKNAIKVYPGLSARMRALGYKL